MEGEGDAAHRRSVGPGKYHSSWRTKAVLASHGPLETVARTSGTMPTITRLSSEESRQALYIDFEGRTDQPPVLLGCTRGYGVWHATTDPRFEPLAIEAGIEPLSLSAAVERIIQRAEKRDRLIVAWTEHELDVVRQHTPEHLDRFQARYVNARKVAVHWRNKLHGGRKPEIGALAEYLTLVGHRVPEGAGPGRAGETIGILVNAFERGRRPADLTDNQRRRWADLLEHNRHDCLGMRRVCRIAADAVELAESSAGRAVPRNLTRSRATIAT